MSKKPLIILTGPTAVGKTALSIQLAKAIHGSVISADSMQVYRGMDIGTAKITEQEMQGVRHYLIDVLDPDENFNVVWFQQMAARAMQDIYDRGEVPILTGGTGFYIQAVLYDIDFTEEKEDPALRRKLEDYAEEHGPHALHQMLQDVDPESARTIHENNIKRTVRALEFYQKTGTRISDHNRMERQKQSPYEFCYFVLNDDRKHLYDRIEQRVDQMMDQGLVEEVDALLKSGVREDALSMQGIGYKEIVSYLKHRTDLDTAVCTLKTNTRHFAKRQLTWFRREKDVIWINKPDFDYDDSQILDFMKLQIRRNTHIIC